MNKYDFINQKISIWTQIIQFSIIFLSVFLIAILPFNSVIYSINQNKTINKALDEKKIHEVILNDFKTFQTGISSDIKILRDDLMFENYLESSTIENRTMLENRFLQFIKFKDYYSQIRFIDTSGMEIIRVNSDKNGIYLVKSSKLQNKSARYYFNDILSKKRDDLYLSDIDLNVENNEVELPFTPMIRVGASVYDKDNHLRGILVLNHQAKPLIKGFMDLNQTENNNSNYIIDRSGNYLFHENADYTWGNYTNSGINFDKNKPEILEKMNSEFAFIEGDDSIYVYTSVADYTGLINPDVLFVTEIPRSSYTIFTTSHIITSLSLWILLSLVIFLFYKQLKLKTYIKRIIGIIYHGIDQNPVVAILTDSSGEIIYVNEAFEKLTGYSFYDVYKKNPNLLKSGEMSQDNYKDMWDTILSGKSWNGEFHNKCKDESYYWAEAQISAIFDKRGNVEHFLALQNNITEKKDLLKKYHDLALKDPLTGAFNRNIYSLDDNEDILKNTFRKNGSIIYMIDIDHFKNVNDKYGHTVGDEILEKIVDHITAHVRDSDLIIRYGGEEFLLILSILNIEDGLEFGDRLRNYFVDNPIKTSCGLVPIRISIGMTTPRTNNEDIQEVIKRVDSALYEAKNTGRNKLIYRK